MRHAVLPLFLLALALPASAEEPAITSLSVHEAHGDGKTTRTETITALRTKDGPRLSIVIEQKPEKPAETTVELREEDWVALVRLVEGHGLSAWEAPALAAPDWGSQGYDITRKDTLHRSWNGPFDTWAPPVALFERMAELAHQLAPKTELQDFRASAPPATRRIRIWNIWKDTAPRNGAPTMDIEAEERAGKWTLVAREGAFGPETANEIRTAELTKAEWDDLVKLATDETLTKWDGKTEKTDAAWGTLGIDTDLGDSRVLLTWHREIPEGKQPRKLWEALYLLAGRKNLLETKGDK